jgi:hypothetical protein
MEPLMRRRELLTGATRGRPSWFARKVVLQVEVESQVRDGYPPCPPPPGCLQPGAWVEQERERQERKWRTRGTYWRDATAHDLEVLAPRPSFRTDLDAAV